MATKTFRIKELMGTCRCLYGGESPDGYVLLAGKHPSSARVIALVRDHAIWDYILTHPDATNLLVEDDEESMGAGGIRRIVVAPVVWARVLADDDQTST